MADHHKIIYQMALRAFTPEGTLKAATKLLSHVASLNVDIIYLCPVFKEDMDEDRMTWSPRQIASETNNAKNPYKIIDFFHVDEEYGTDQDLKDFISEAHRLGLLVLLDLVYLHCGRNAVFIKDHPDYVEHDETGNVKIGAEWPFARLNFESRGLREYLIENMKTLVADFGADGFRCDVGTLIPLDFWREAVAAIRNRHPNLFMLLEGGKTDYVQNPFDSFYDVLWMKKIRQIFSEDKTAFELRNHHLYFREKYGEDASKALRALDNHDTVNDCGKDRNEIVMTSEGVEAALVLAITFQGVPFIWNGYEICDDAENSMFSNRFYGRKGTIDWSKGFTENGKRRLDFVRCLNAFYHKKHEAFVGKHIWLNHNAPESVLAYVREGKDQKVLVAVNCKNESMSVKLKDFEFFGETAMSCGATVKNEEIVFEPYGYLVMT